MNTVQLKNFLMIAEIGSFTKAEEALHTTKTALKKQMDSLESELGAPIFYRSSKGLHLTEAGQIFYNRMKVLHQEYLDTVAECRRVHSENYREIKIAMYSITNMLNWYMDVEQNSDFKIQQIMSSANTHEQNFAMLADGNVDFLEYEDNDQIYQRGFCYTKIIEDNLCCIMRRNHELAKKTKIKPEDLSGRQIFCWTSRSSATREIRKYAERFQWNLKGIPYSPETILKVCNEGAIYILSRNSAAMFEPLCVIPFEPVIPYCRGLVYKAEKEELLQEMLKAAKP